RPVNAPRLNGSAHANPVRPRISLQCRKFRNRVVVRLAFAVPEPRQKPHRHHDDADPDPEFCLFLHDGRSNYHRTAATLAVAANPPLPIPNPTTAIPPAMARQSRCRPVPRTAPKLPTIP